MRKGLIKNKKAKFFILFVVVGMIIAESAMLVSIVRTRAEFKQFGEIGIKQILLIESYQDAEESLMYVDLAAKWSAEESYIETARKGALPPDSLCGKHYNFMMWDFEDENCIPIAIKEEEKNFEKLSQAFEIEMNEKLNEFFRNVPELQIPLDNYDINVYLREDKKTAVSGQAFIPLSFDVKRSLTDVGYETYNSVAPPQVPIGKTRKEKIANVAKAYKELIEKYCAPESVPTSLMVGLIVQESGGNPQAISPTGCAGLNQFCYGTAKGYQPEIFREGMLTPCSCSGSTCKYGVAACNADNDDRFDYEKSIHAGCLKLGQDSKQFLKYSAKTEFVLATYNGGAAPVKDAIKLTGESNPGWQSVANKITPEVLSSYPPYNKWSHEKRVRKVKEITGYVISILAMQQEAETQLRGGDAP